MDVDKWMTRMVEAVQPHCDEPISAALTASHAGSMGNVVFSKLAGVNMGLSRTSELPNPVFLAVGTDTVYALAYKPRGTKWKIKGEVARWPRQGMQVGSETTKTMCYFTIVTADGGHYEMEAAIFMGGQALVDRFLAALEGT